MFSGGIELWADVSPSVVERITGGTFLISNGVRLIPECYYEQVNWSKQNDKMVR